MALLSNHNLLKSSMTVTCFSFSSFSLNKGQSFLKWPLAPQKKQDNLSGEGDLEGCLLVYLVTLVAIFSSPDRTLAMLSSKVFNRLILSSLPLLVPVY